MNDEDGGLGSIGIDRHGDFNLLLVNNWSNLFVENQASVFHRRGASSKPVEIKGSNLNTLLVGIFQLLGSPKLYDRDFPGGVVAWEELLDAVFVCLLQSCTMEEVLYRIFALFELVTHFIQVYQTQSKQVQQISASVGANAMVNGAMANAGNGSGGPPSGGSPLPNATLVNAAQHQLSQTHALLQYVQLLCNGSIMFLFYWYHHGRMYFREEDILHLYSFCCNATELVNHYRTKSQAQSLFLSRFTSKAGKGGAAANKNNSGDSASKGGETDAKKEENQTIVTEKTLSRLQDLVTTLQSALCPTPSASLFTGASVPPVCPTTYHATSIRRRNYYYSSMTAMNPNLPILEGKWAAGQMIEEKEKQKENLKAAFAAAPQVKLEIFGGAMLLDVSDDDDDIGDNAPPAILSGQSTTDPTGSSSGQGGGGSSKGPPPAMISRISVGTKLLGNSVTINAERVLDILDVIELARQWTLVDHFLFTQIDLSPAMLVPCFHFNDNIYQTNGGSSVGNASLYTDSKYLDTLGYGGYKRFVDRFNMTSQWITACILQGNSPELRGGRITKFIKLAVELHKLGNYHGLMSIMTALQQGCINRLKISFDHVNVQEQQSFARLKVSQYYILLCLYM